MRKPYIVYIITKLELGGAQKVCLSLCQGLQQAGFSTSLISGTQGPLVEHAKKTSHTILLDSFTREVSTKSLAHEWHCFRLLVSHLKKLKHQYPDLIVHTHSTKAGILGRWAAWFAGVPTRIHTVHGYAFHDHQNKLAWGLIYLSELLTSFITTHFVCVSSHDADLGKKLFPRFSKKYSIIRAAVSEDKFVPASIPINENHFIFGTIACFKPQKNLFDLLHAFERVYADNKRARLEIIGDGILRPDLEAWIMNHNLRHVITLHGWQSEVAPIMRSWHAFALTSLWEGLPCAIVEARLLKLPVISYRTGGIQDVIQDHVNGLLYNQKDWEGIASGMHSLMHDHTLYASLRTHPDNLKDFHHDTMINNHVQLYTKLQNG